MSQNRRHSLILLASLFAPACIFAQTPASSAPQPANAPQSTNKIVLDVVVNPRSAYSAPPVANLSPSNFTLLDNKVPQPITSFRAVSRGQEPPTQVLLVVDAINAPYQSIAYARPQIDKFLQANGGHLAYPTSIVVANETGTQMQPVPSTDGNAVSAVFDKYEVGLRAIRRDAGFYGATDRVQVSLQSLSSLLARERATPGRKIILWISPGWALLSGPRVQLTYNQSRQIFAEIVDLSTQLRQSNTTLYSINPIGAGEGVMAVNYYQTFLKGIQKPSQAQIGDLGLQVLAVQSGGRSFNSDNDITGQLQAALADTTAYYELTFTPPPADHPDAFHQIDVKLNDSNLTARTRNGYYALPSSTGAAPLPSPTR
jgi:VWFA-related protein